MARIVIVEDKATGTTRELDLSKPAPVKKTKPVTFNGPIQSSVFTESIRVDMWNSSHRDAPRTWKYWYKNAFKQFDRPDLMKRSKKIVYPGVRGLNEKGLCIYPHINHF